MTYRELREMFEGFGEGYPTVLFPEPEEPDFEPLEESWAAAELEAADALREWRMRPGPEAYAVYRAAADRASAAQDALRSAAEGQPGVRRPPAAGRVARSPCRRSR